MALGFYTAGPGPAHHPLSEAHAEAQPRRKSNKGTRLVVMTAPGRSPARGWLSSCPRCTTQRTPVSVVLLLAAAARPS